MFGEKTLGKQHPESGLLKADTSFCSIMPICYLAVAFILQVVLPNRLVGIQKGGVATLVKVCLGTVMLKGLTYSQGQ